MKRHCFFFFCAISIPCIMYGQSLNDGMYSEEWKRERDAIVNGNQERQRWQEDYYYKQLMQQQQQRNAEIERKVRKATERAQQGIQFSTDNGTVRPQSSYATKQKIQAQMKKARREAGHQQWLANKRTAQAAAAERARLERERKEREERERKEREERERRQRIYNQTYADELWRSAPHYNQLHSNVDYKATEGFERMMYTQPEGTERIRSGYVPSSIHIAKSDIASIIPKHSNGKTVSLTLSGNENSTLNSDWEQCMDKMFTMEQVEFKHIKFDNKTGQYFDDFKDKLEDGQMQMLLYYMKSNNVQDVTYETDEGTFIKKTGMIPNAVGKNNEGQYIFEANDGNRIFVVSENGRHMQVLTFEQHFWEDENIVKMIQQDGLGNYCKEAFKIKGVLSYNELKNMTYEEIVTRLPEIKTEMKMTMVDNSDNIKYQYYYLAPQNENMPIGNAVMGVSAELSGGGKMEATASLCVPDIAKATIDHNYEKSTGKTDNNTTYGSTPDLGFTAAQASTSVTVGRVKKRGNNFILCTGEIKADAKYIIDYKTLVKLNPIRGGIKFTGLKCKNITTSASEIPSAK